MQADSSSVDIQLLLSAVSVCPSGNTSATQNADRVYTSGDKTLGFSLPLKNDTNCPPFLRGQLLHPLGVSYQARMHLDS